MSRRSIQRYSERRLMPSCCAAAVLLPPTCCSTRSIWSRCAVDSLPGSGFGSADGAPVAACTVAAAA